MTKSVLSFIVLLSVSFLCSAQNPVLWGLTSDGGTGRGNLFSVTLTGTETGSYNFGGGTDGVNPQGSLMEANNKLLYGMTQDGGTLGDGTIFSYNVSTGIETDIHDWGSGTDGQTPQGSLIQAGNGLLYGMTDWGGTKDKGTIFSYDTATGIETDLHDFGIGSDGYFAPASLIQASNGLLYGMTDWGGTYGGSYGDGVIFSYNITTGVETVLHNFGNGTDGINPTGSLKQISDSVLYGTTQVGGVNGKGTLFSYNINSGIEIDIHDFGSGTDGEYPDGSLLQVNDSLLFGLTFNGGVNSKGIIFSYNILTGKETDDHDFTGTDGQGSEGSLIQASNGLLYGMTIAGGANSKGVIFSYAITTATETDIHDFTGADGDAPAGDLLEFDTIPVLSIVPQYPLICSGTSVALEVSGGSGYSWSPSTGLSATTGDSVVATPLKTTTYTVTSKSGGITVTDTVVVTVLPAPNKPVITVSASGDTLFSSASNSNQWFENDTLIQGATNSILVITGKPPGSYTVAVTNVANGCSSISDSVIISGTTGTLQLQVIGRQLSIFPNPATGEITILVDPSAENVAMWRLQLSDVLGRTLYTNPSLNYTNRVDLGDLQGGIYFITVITKTGSAAVPVVKQ